MFQKIGVLIFLILLGIFRAALANDLKEIGSYFNEARSATGENKKFWGVDLYGPILLVEPESRNIFANVEASSGVLEKKEQVFIGKLPDNIGIANTCVNWEGKSWAMVMLPISDNRSERLNLLTHELFHCSQVKLGFPANNPSNSHLNEKEGRILFRLELQALKKAIAAETISERKKHIISALTFRTYRQESFNEAKVEENLLELNEGLAEYTGLMMSGRGSNQIKAHLINNLSSFVSNPSFVRSFAYVTTPAYGYLLFTNNKNWHKEISSDDNLIDYLQKVFQIQLTIRKNDLPNELSDDYNGIAIYEEESLRDEEIKRIKQEYINKFVKNSNLAIKLEKMNITFDPRNLVPLDGYGTVYPNLKITDTWGVLTVENGALLATTWDKVSVSKPTKISKNRAVGDGWVLELADGYSIRLDKKGNNYYLLAQ
ncbi:hypothetical protein [Aliikangiella coralliicola]|uniref:Uncharacterized protein n=1 Tax=Aliikangiella coralliicola TaxID=2592383 RepID=A0A545UDQ6_9GAMM|nr:hypothetical protein [Aliikangiella coralliicola]TQV87597.1 hypothetical protein FLL46_12055 [Aliikangiella coralliicola]